MKFLILDFDLSEGLESTTRSIRGWWFGASTIYQNPRAGDMFADRLQANLSRLEFVNTYSRTDLKYYFARKKQRVREAYGHLSDEEIETLMSEISPVEYARELGADKVIVVRIIENYLDANRTIHWWHSKAHVLIQIYDVRSGTIEWDQEYQLKKWLTSQFSVQDELAKLVVKDMKDDYFRPLALAQAP
jgi:hypothetical protein